jgi:membrane associated rhomboid family serine protease
MNNNAASLILMNILICVLMGLVGWAIIAKVHYMSGFIGLWLLGATVSREYLCDVVKKEGVRNEVK